MTDFAFAPAIPAVTPLHKDIFDIFEEAVENEYTQEIVAEKIVIAYEEALNKPTVIDLFANAIDYTLVDFSKVEQSIIDQFDKTTEEGREDSNYTMEFDLIEQGVIDAWARQTTMLSIGGSAPTTALPPPATNYGSFVPPSGWAFVSQTQISNSYAKGTIPRMPAINVFALPQNSYIISKRFTDLFTKHIAGISIVYTGYLPPAGTIPFPPAPPMTSPPNTITLL